MNRFPCPHCGRMIEARAVSSGRFNKMQTFEMSRRWEPSHSVPALPAQSEPRVDFAEAVRQSPARPATVESDFSVIALQAIGCGVAAGVLSVGGVFGFGWPWWVPVMVLGGTTSLAWFILLTDQRKLLRVVERIVGRDIDGDGAVGKPQNETMSIVHEFVDKENRRIDRYPFSAEMEGVIKKVAVAVNNGRSFSRRGLKGVVSESDYNRLLGILQERNLVFPKTPGSPNAGYELTVACKKIFKYYL